MEFTLSRAVMMVCGVILLSAVAVPVSEVCGGNQSNDLDALAEHDARILDAFYNSGLDVLYLDGSAMLPSASYSLVIDGYFVTLSDGNGTVHEAAMKHSTENITLSYGEIKTVYRTIFSDVFSE